MISILNYGVGNIASLQRIIERAGGSSKVINDPKDILAADKLLLPGVGSFDYAMRNLIDLNLIDSLNFAVLKKETPILGICLGMQLMCKSSQEGSLQGLGWINAEVIKFNNQNNSDLKIPHMGWNQVSLLKNNLLFSQDGLEKRFYFVHSYYVKCNDKEDILSNTFHGSHFTSSFSKKNIFGVQFHPEKSHKYGIDLFKNYIKYNAEK